MGHFRILAGELTASEILSKLEDHQRVIIEVEMLGMSVDMAIRKTQDTYYCDTPVKLLTYETEGEMKRCLERYRLAASDA